MAADDDGDGQEPKGKDVPRELHESLRERLEAIIPDLVRRTVSAGIGAVASTEDGLRRLSRDLQLPNVAGYLADTADTTKDKVLEIVAREVRDFLSHVNLSDEIARMLTTLSLEVKTEIRFIPNSERMIGSEPDVKASVKVKRNDKAIGADEVASDKDRDSRSRLRFWRREGENTVVDHGEDDEGEGHDR